MFLSLAIQYFQHFSPAASEGGSRSPVHDDLTKKAGSAKKRKKLHEAIFCRYLSSLFDSFSVVPFSSHAILIIFGASLPATARENKENVEEK